MATPKLHPRTLRVQKFKGDLNSAILAVIEQNKDITYVELLSALNECSAHWLKYALRTERHPDNPDKPAEWE